MNIVVVCSCPNVAKETAKPAKGFGKTPLQAVYFVMLRARVGKNLSGRSNVCVCVCVCVY